MKYHIALLVVALGLIASISRAADAEKSELEGTWKPTHIVVDGKEQPVAEDARMIFKGNASTFMSGGKAVFTAELKFDPKSNPKSAEGTYTSGPNKGKSAHTIYKLDGDKVTFCRGAIGGAKPTAFESKVGSGQLLSEYTRVKE